MTVVDTKREALSATLESIEESRMYRVVFVNDDTTPMDFVVAVLVEVFGHAVKAATRIMLKVHKEGLGTAGIYPHEIAEAKAVETVAKARLHGYPLRCKIERDEP